MKIERTVSFDHLPAVQDRPATTGSSGSPGPGWNKQSNFDGAVGMRPLWQPPQGNPFVDSDDFGHMLHSVFDRFGSTGAAIVGNAINQLRNGTQPPVSTRLPQPGDVMLWGPNAGDRHSAVGKAHPDGHAAVVEKVTDNGDGTITLRVSERGWDNADGVDANGVPYRDIRLKKNADGTLSLLDGRPLPPGVGFISPAGNSSRNSPPSANAKGSGGAPPGPQNPPIGRNPPENPADHPRYQINQTPPHDPHDIYYDCVGYIHDIPRFRSLIEKWDRTGDGPPATKIPINSSVPKPGDLLVYGAANAGDDVVGRAGKDGHVAYVEAVKPNYDPPGDPNGKIVSYTVTVSEAGWGGEGDKRSLRTFTVPADQNGNAVLPKKVGFYDPNAPDAASPSSGGAQPSSGAKIAHGSVYTVQPGDTLSDIANRAGVSLEALLAANSGIADPSVIVVGQKIRIP